MQEDFRLIGDFTPTELNDSGITLVAPGLFGQGTWHSRRETGQTRALTGEQGLLDQALAESGAEDRHTLVLEAPTPPANASGTRSAGGVADDELLLQVPLAPGEAGVVMYTDEAGVISFHYGQPAAAAQAELPSRAFGAGQQVQFRLRLRGGESHGTGGSRGLVGRVVAKVIKVLVVKVFPNPVGRFAAARVQAWEQKYRAQQGLHGGTWEQLLDPRPTHLDDLRPCIGRRSLLLIHGTTSTTAGAFAGLARSPALLDRLATLYQGRVLGFNHHTMSVPVAENVRQLYAALAEAPGEYHFDVVCHSRGGLVARALAHLADADVAALSLAGGNWQRPARVKLRIGRIVFVATPNAGTALADPPRIPDFVERLTNYVNMLPDAPLTIGAGALLSLAGAVAEVGLPRLPGLADQSPGSVLQQKLAPPPGGTEGFHAFCANYEPEGSLVSVVKDAAVDRIFGTEANDLVVPTGGVARTPYYELPAERVFRFEPGRHVHHSAFFGQPEFAKVADWLGAGR